MYLCAVVCNYGLLFYHFLSFLSCGWVPRMTANLRHEKERTSRQKNQGFFAYMFWPHDICTPSTDATVCACSEQYLNIVITDKGFSDVTNTGPLRHARPASPWAGLDFKWDSFALSFCKNVWNNVAIFCYFNIFLFESPSSLRRN